MFIIFTLLVLIVFVISRNLLLVLLVLEIIGFIVLYFIALEYSRVSSLDCYALTFFAVLVIEGVIGLRGLIRMVRFSGNDYISLRSPLKF